ncbi:hypothetical protein E2C01_037872 [Portunus trituberculatus]|uniref:Uncharacterized protein n=1 Tax=Portunus trituberculatus TaxID=210409 RepID=A0A5B7FFR6_PORTR|nr:hypothetical protein [Portunus trituberculatus]
MDDGDQTLGTSPDFEGTQDHQPDQWCENVPRGSTCYLMRTRAIRRIELLEGGEVPSGEEMPLTASVRCMSKSEGKTAATQVAECCSQKAGVKTRRVIPVVLWTQPEGRGHGCDISRGNYASLAAATAAL